MGKGGQKSSLTEEGISLQNFQTFSFNPFSTLLRNYNAIPSASPRLLSLNQDHLSKRKGSSG